jgi:hypothetical protein
MRSPSKAVMAMLLAMLSLAIATSPAERFINTTAVHVASNSVVRSQHTQARCRRLCARDLSVA